MSGLVTTTPATVPNSPTITGVIRGDRSATISFTPPVNNGGSVITLYTVTSSGGQTATGGAGSITIVGLTNGISYTFTVTATNALGIGAASIASSAVTPATLPDAPTNLAGAIGDGSVSLTWSAPENNGGSPITSYTVTSNV